MLLILSHFIETIDQTGSIWWRYKLIKTETRFSVFNINCLCLHLLDRRRHSRLSDQKYKTLNTVMCSYKTDFCTNFSMFLKCLTKNVFFVFFNQTKIPIFRLNSDVFWKTGSRFLSRSESCLYLFLFFLRVYFSSFSIQRTKERLPPLCL